ncbi:anthranilate synthase component I family protein [Oecophyllibacter saccharovorans]|uniref:Anthranilate synthase component I family protein n=2 Tax=Oecophyllibacter saccharovorans TaxID=2558360 RepID=A0A506UKH8_9PROT|nr:anthranilate synthase component I family protein [Oecophyllibacter saccharovorans]
MPFPCLPGLSRLFPLVSAGQLPAFHLPKISPGLRMTVPPETALSPSVTALPWQPPQAYLGLLSRRQGASEAGRALPSTGPVFLDSGSFDKATAESRERQRWSLLSPRPEAALVLPRLKPGAQDGLEPLRRFAQSHRPHRPVPPSPDLPFTGGIIGVLSYGAGLELQDVSSRHTAQDDWPHLLALVCTSFLLFDHAREKLWWISPEQQPAPAPRPLTAAFPPLENWQPDFTEHGWGEAVEETRRLIGAGDIFQANLTMRWHGGIRQADGTHADPAALYARLRQGSPAPFGAYLDFGTHQLMSASVERFLSLSPGGTIETRPIKGTSAVSDDPTTDTALRDALAHDTKELAENLMITDLMRNDIGRVSRPGSVSVPQLARPERFARVHHLVSSVTGELAEGEDAFSLLEATMPPGSVTGAPKKRALEVIDALERSPRGAYCGTLFRLGWDGALDSSVLIRTVTGTPEEPATQGCDPSAKPSGATCRFALGAGGGITWPSEAQAEYRETCLKAAPLLQALRAAPDPEGPASRQFQEQTP